MDPINLWLWFALAYGCGSIDATVPKHLMKSPFAKCNGNAVNKNKIAF